MCVISVLPKGKSKYGDNITKFITNGFNNNHHGSGFMYKKNKSNIVNISKGYNSLNNLLEDLEKLKLTENDELVIHHRIGNVGAIDDSNTHPFPCVNDEQLLSTLKIGVKLPCLVHNGTFQNLIEFKGLNPTKSDTYAFARYIMSNDNILSILKTDSDYFKTVFQSILANAKLCFLFPDRDLLMLGSFIEDDGYYHSNMGYKNEYIDWGGYNYNNLPTHSSKDNNQTKPTLNTVLHNYNKECINSILDKPTLTLSGKQIEINEFNYDKFVYTLKNPSHYLYDKVFVLKSLDKDSETQLLHCERMGLCKKLSDIYKEFDIIPYNKYRDYYREYLILQRDLEITDKLINKVFKVLNHYKSKNFDHKITIEKLQIKVSKFSLIELYNYYKHNYITDKSKLLISAIHDDLIHVHNLENVSS